MLYSYTPKPRFELLEIEEQTQLDSTTDIQHIEEQKAEYHAEKNKDNLGNIREKL